MKGVNLSYIRRTIILSSFWRPTLIPCRSESWILWRRMGPKHDLTSSELLAENLGYVWISDRNCVIPNSVVSKLYHYAKHLVQYQLAPLVLQLVLRTGKATLCKQKGRIKRNKLVQNKACGFYQLPRSLLIFIVTRPSLKCFHNNTWLKIRRRRVAQLRLRENCKTILHPVLLTVRGVFGLCGGTGRASDCKLEF